MTAAMVGFGGLLWTRHRLLRREAPLDAVAPAQARLAARAVFIITGFSAFVVCLIAASRLSESRPIALLSVAMPVVGLAWLFAIARRIRQVYLASRGASAQADRPSRRPPKRDSRTPPLASQSESASNRHVSA